MFVNFFNSRTLSINFVPNVSANKPGYYNGWSLIVELRFGGSRCADRFCLY